MSRTHSSRAWVVRDSAFFDVARKQIELYEQLQNVPNQDQGRLLYWGMGFAAAAIVMVCAAMEAHANYLYRRAAATDDPEIPNHSKLAMDDWECFERSRHKDKWLIVSEAVAGRKVLFPGKSPFQEFCRAIWRRDQFVAHAKMEMKDFPGGVVLVDGSRFEELKELTVPNARTAVKAAQHTVQAVYSAMGRQWPSWAK